MRQKIENNIPFVFIAIILLNTLFSQELLLKKIGQNYTYLYIPIFWIVLGAVSFLLLRKKHYKNRIRRDILFWIIVAGVMYLILRFSTGIFEGFGYNALDSSFFGILRSLFTYIVPHICREIVRAAMLKDCKHGKTRTKVICVLVCVVLGFSEMNVSRMLRSLHTPFGVFEQLGGNLMPAIVTSAMLTLAALYAGFLPGIIYRVTTLTLFYVLPIIPDSSWLTIALLGCLIPFIFAIIINYSVGVANHTITRRDVNSEKPAEWIILFIVLFAFVLFITGVLPVYPVAVATGSMEPNIMTGDMVVVNKTDEAKGSLEVGDVIQYKRGSYTVIHRIIEVQRDHDEVYYITKGDNNSSADSGKVTQDMIIGKVEFRVRYAGWLTLWMHSASVEEEEQEVDVETGGHNP